MSPPSDTHTQTTCTAPDLLSETLPRNKRTSNVDIGSVRSAARQSSDTDTHSHILLELEDLKRRVSDPEEKAISNKDASTSLLHQLVTIFVTSSRQCRR